MKTLGVIYGSALALTCLGCAAGMAVRQVVDDDTERGIRYYESAPYLLVYTDNDGGLVTKILYLPDQSRKMAVRGYNKGATLKMALEFKNGVLTTAKSSVDQTELPAAVLAAVQKAAGAALSAAANAKDESRPTSPTPYLFKIVVKPDGVELVGGQPVTAQHVLVPTVYVNPPSGDKK